MVVLFLSVHILFNVSVHNLQLQRWSVRELVWELMERGQSLSPAVGVWQMERPMGEEDSRKFTGAYKLEIIWYFSRDSSKVLGLHLSWKDLSHVFFVPFPLFSWFNQVFSLFHSPTSIRNFISILGATIEFTTGIFELFESAWEYFYHLLDNVKDLEQFSYIYYSFLHLPFVILMPNI